jgi:hypothetical protein
MRSVSWRHVWAFLLAGVLLFALAIACGGEEEEPTPTPTATVTATVTATPSPAATPTPEGPVAVEVTTDKAVYGQGEPVTMTLTLTAYEPMTLYFRTSQRYDFEVSTAPGERVWLWSGDQAFLQVLGDLGLQPGDQVSYSEAWDQRDESGLQVAPGDYLVTANSVGCDSNYENCGALAESRPIQIVGP